MNTTKTPALLQNKSLRLLMVARVSTNFAYQMLTVAIGWQMYSMTHSAFYLGLVGLVQFLPMLLLSLFVGHLADRYDRRKIITISQIFEGTAILALAYGSYSEWITKERFLIIIFLIAVAHSFQGPPMQALLPNIVSKDIFPRASALMSSVSEFAVIIGPGVGGILYAFGPTLVYGLTGILIFISSILISQLTMRKEETKAEPASLKTLFAGISFIKGRPIILGAISLDLFAVLFGGATALLPIYASEILKIGSFGLGILRSAPAVGALLMSAYLAKKPLKKNVGRTMFTAVIFFGLSTIVFAISKSVIISFIALFVLGASDVISVVIRSTLVQLETPDFMRGRVSSVNMIFIGTSNQLGEFESGATAALLGPQLAALVGGIGTILVVLSWMKLFPSILNVNKFEDIKSYKLDENTAS
ncbi:MFS transporter [Clostridium folliculivorans]|uniref:MFS transporter n=1 Tax=Clostridium folliculivorans TaxID=2886038 RepID=A0A9W5Y165_9CLOT|nr:MFS transporter [Clostridium folliculivorans]GKU24650.1 MFS transporter [Clostridium folliculivorans]GKU30748.1 MFS transporter [Clostridium folliculivorans]